MPLPAMTLTQSRAVLALLLGAALLPVPVRARPRLQQLDDCSASLDGRVINLQPLARVDGVPR